MEYYIHSAFVAGDQVTLDQLLHCLLVNIPAMMQLLPLRNMLEAVQRTSYR